MSIDYHSNEDDAMNDAANASDGLQKEMTGLQIAVAVGSGVVFLLLVIAIAAVVLSRGAGA